MQYAQNTLQTDVCYDDPCSIETIISLRRNMWCSDCRLDFSTEPGSVVQICPSCQQAEKAGQRTRRVPKLDQAVAFQPNETRLRIETSGSQPIRYLPEAAEVGTSGCIWVVCISRRPGASDLGMPSGAAFRLESGESGFDFRHHDRLRLGPGKPAEF